MDITSLLVRDILGLIDVDESVVKIREALDKKREIELEQTLRISEAIQEVFANYTAGERIPMPILTGMVANKLDTKPYVYKQVVLQIEAFIRSSPTVYDISRGRNGGVLRIKQDNE